MINTANVSAWNQRTNDANIIITGIMIVVSVFAHQRILIKQDKVVITGTLVLVRGNAICKNAQLVITSIKLHANVNACPYHAIYNLIGTLKDVYVNAILKPVHQIKYGMRQAARANVY